MGISISLVLIAVGAILTWAVTATVSGIDINTVGVILMIVGAAGLVLSMIFWSSWGGFAPGARRRPSSETTRCRVDRVAATGPARRAGPVAYDSSRWNPRR